MVGDACGKMCNIIVCFYVSCMDCGSQTASVDYRKPEQRLEAARQAAWLWNTGKTIYTGCSD